MPVKYPSSSSCMEIPLNNSVTAAFATAPSLLGAFSLDSSAANAGRKPYGRAVNPIEPITVYFDREMDTNTLSSGLSLRMIKDSAGKL